MDIVVFGAGSLGSLIGGLLARVHDVTLVGRDPHIKIVRRSGLETSGEFEFTTYPEARTDAPPTADLAVVAVKAFDTGTAARALAGRAGVALSIQNGMGNEAVLRTELDRVLAGTCTYGALLREPGRVECTGRGEVALGPLASDAGTIDPADREAAMRVEGAFRRAGIETALIDDMETRLWEKLAVNTAINPVTALARVPNGALRTGDAHRIAVAAARETVRVAREQGLSLSDDRAIEALEEVVENTAANQSSMLQDVREERRTEIDAISGFVADRAGTPVPVTETLCDLLRAWERAHGLR